ncbi:uncharacterized protein PG998_012483 [Apiospora kogelbergensis]|uniref:uncharacterized protein n=1 Tax=Apiospora kogelbergensis TaxID=1337665 RepID=UPI00313209E7
MAPSRAAATTKKPFEYCEDSKPAWDPVAYLADAELHERAAAFLAKDDFASAIAVSFNLPPRDAYVYHAIVSVTLAQVQHVIGMGAANGLHTWYRHLSPPSSASPANDNNKKNDDAAAAESETQQKQPPGTKALGKPAAPPPRPDIDTYLSIFSPTTVTPNVLKTFALNAKKNSLRVSIAAHLLEKRYLHPALPNLQIPRLKKITSLPAPNPYLTFLEWACRNLEWAGPSPESEAVRSAHHVLPVLMHHFGCVCPSHEALAILKEVAAGRDVLDVGSGNGYWSFMLRQYCCSSSSTTATATSKKSKTSSSSAPDQKEQRIIPIDNAQSAWRANWVSDTLVSDGVAYLQKHPESKDAVLLLVYPIVGGGVAGGEEGGFTRNLLRAYRGDTLAVAGTQNHNGYTGFRDRSMDEFMAQDPALAAEWVKVAQVPLPSFPGKDEALFVYQRGSRAPPKDDGDGGDSTKQAATSQ